VLPPFKFRRANPTSVPSLEFWLPFYQEKGRSHSATSRGKPVQRKTAPIRLSAHLSPERERAREKAFIAAIDLKK